MQTTVFKCGNSQAIRIPKELHLHSKKVEIYRRGAEIIIREKPQNLKEAFAFLPSFSKDFMRKRADSLPQKRKFPK